MRSTHNFLDSHGRYTQPLSLLHPLLYNAENFHIANMMFQMYIDPAQMRPDPRLTLESICAIDEHKWLEKCKVTLVTPETHPNLQDFVQSLIERASMIHEDVRIQQPKPLIALDTETTGLSKLMQRFQGQNVIYTQLVGVCLAISDKEGYYIPVLHNELDKIKNFPLDQVISMLQTLVDKTHLALHNSVYDLEVLAQHGVRLKNLSHSDTMLIGGLKGYRSKYMSLGLKKLSECVLGRKMLEIKEIVVTDPKSGKKDIQLSNLPASNAYVYGCSDAMNTYGLLKTMLRSDNPYYVQPRATKLDHMATRFVRGIYRVGLPVNYERAYQTLRTMLRRITILEQLFLATITDKSVLISSPLQVGSHMMNLLKVHYEAKFNNNQVCRPGDQAFMIFTKRLADCFGINVSVKALKNGTTTISANSGSDVLNNLTKSVRKWDFLPDSVVNEILFICEIVDEYRSLAHELGIVYKMIRYCYNDDMNMCRCGISLKLNGADTTRFTNASSVTGAAFDRISLGGKPSLEQGDGLTGFNAQGIARTVNYKAPAKLIKNFDLFPAEVVESHRTLEAMVDAHIDTLFKTDSLH